MILSQQSCRTWTRIPRRADRGRVSLTRRNQEALMNSRTRPVFRRHARLAANLGAGAIALSLGLALHPARADQTPPPQPQDLGPYIVLGWNDLGMHCANQNFQDLCILPPYNTFWATVIQRGNSNTPPHVVGSGFHVN